jgi:hypothetical protein
MTEVDLERKNNICTEGTHTFKIIKSEEKMGGSGYPYWNFQLNCVDEGPDKGLAVWAMISLSPQARFKLDQFLDSVDAPTKGKISHEHFVGKTMRATVKWDTYNGSISAKPDAYLPAGSSVNPSAKPTLDSTQETKLPKDATTGFKAPF